MNFPVQSRRTGRIDVTENQTQPNRSKSAPPTNSPLQMPAASPPQKRSDGEGPGERPTKWRKAADKIPPTQQSHQPRFAADRKRSPPKRKNGGNPPTSGSTASRHSRPRLPTVGTFGANNNAHNQKCLNFRTNPITKRLMDQFPVAFSCRHPKGKANPSSPKPQNPNSENSANPVNSDPEKRHIFNNRIHQQHVNWQKHTAPSCSPVNSKTSSSASGTTKTLSTSHPTKSRSETPPSVTTTTGWNSEAQPKWPDKSMPDSKPAAPMTR